MPNETPKPTPIADTPDPKRKVMNETEELKLKSDMVRDMGARMFFAEKALRSIALNHAESARSGVTEALNALNGNIQSADTPDPLEVCELCNGKGQRLIAWPIGTKAVMKECSDCEGSGKFNADGTPHVTPDPVRDQAMRDNPVIHKPSLCSLCHCGQTLPQSLQQCGCSCHWNDRIGITPPDPVRDELLAALSSAEQRFRTIGMGTCEWEHMTRGNMRATCDIAMMGESECRAAIARAESPAPAQEKQP